MFDAMESGELKSAYVIGENPIQSEADQHRAARLMGHLDFLVVQDLFMTDTAAIADVVFPAAAGAFESEGTVTSSERRVQRCRRTVDPPGEAREDLAIIFALAKALGHDWGPPDAERVWNELRCAVAGARRHELRAARSQPRPALALLRRDSIRAKCSCTAACGSGR